MSSPARRPDGQPQAPVKKQTCGHSIAPYTHTYSSPVLFTYTVPCRLKKIRCDGSRPACKPCIRSLRGPGSCVWKSNTLTAEAQRDAEYIKLLESRVKGLEAIVVQMALGHGIKKNEVKSEDQEAGGELGEAEGSRRSGSVEDGEKSPDWLHPTKEWFFTEAQG
ncbi:hypothetical protein HK097_004685, partial [Rhizophlyctis rosea]